VRRRLPHLVALLLGILAAVAIGCGNRSNLIPANDASNLKGQLAQIKQDVASGSCDGLASKIQQVRDGALALPNTVDQRLRSRINAGVKALRQTASTDCAAVAHAQAQPDTQPTQAGPATTETQTDTTTTPTDTTTTPTDTTTTPTDTTTTPTDTTTTDPTTTPTTPESVPAPSPDSSGGTPGAPTP
jgi:hypothetical protein